MEVEEGWRRRRVVIKRIRRREEEIGDAVEMRAERGILKAIRGAGVERGQQVSVG